MTTTDSAESKEPALRYEDISPSALIDEQIKAMHEDIAMLNSRKAEFVDVDCPACGGKAKTPVYEKYGLSHVRCDGCATQYVSPRPTPAVLKDFYRGSKNYAYWAKHIFPATAESRKERIFRKRAALVRDLALAQGMGRGTILEVGAGYGLFCETIKETGAFERVIGVEPTPDLAQICRDKGIEVLESFVEDVKLDHPVDVVVNFEVIEHLFDPKSFLEACRDVLSPGGYLVITCPNIAGFETHALGKESDTVDHEHINYFNPRSLSLLAERVGLEPVEVRTPGVLDVDIVHSRVKDASKPPVALDPFLREIVTSDDAKVRDAFQAFITASGLSSNMMLIAKKPKP